MEKIKLNRENKSKQRKDVAVLNMLQNASPVMSKIETFYKMIGKAMG